MKGHYCEQFPGDCTNSTSRFSGYNLKSAQDQFFLNIFDYLALVFTIFSIIYFFLYRKYAFRLYMQLDFSIVTQDDFSVMI